MDPAPNNPNPEQNNVVEVIPEQLGQLAPACSLDMMIGLLCHNITNSACVSLGYARLLKDADPCERYCHIEIISEKLATVYTSHEWRSIVFQRANFEQNQETQRQASLKSEEKVAKQDQYYRIIEWIKINKPEWFEKMGKAMLMSTVNMAINNPEICPEKIMNVFKKYNLI